MPSDPTMVNDPAEDAFLGVLFRLVTEAVQGGRDTESIAHAALVAALAVLHEVDRLTLWRLEAPITWVPVCSARARGYEDSGRPRLGNTACIATLCSVPTIQIDDARHDSRMDVFDGWLDRAEVGAVVVVPIVQDHQLLAAITLQTHQLRH